MLVLQNDKILSLGISIDSDRLGMCILDFTDQILEEETYRLQREAYQPEQILQFLLKCMRSSLSAAVFHRKQ